MSINNTYQKKVEGVLKSLTTVRESVHSLIIESLVNTYKTRNTEYAVYLLNQLSSVQGSFRVQAVVYFYQTIAGLKIANKDGVFTATLNDKEKQDTKQLDQCKLAKNRFWKITPDERELSFCKLENVFNGAITQLARSLEAGETSKQEISEQIEGLWSLINVTSKSKTTFDWLERFKQTTGKTLKSDKLAEETVEPEKIAKPLTDKETEEAVTALQALSSVTN